jgi:hypothetical protein
VAIDPEVFVVNRNSDISPLRAQSKKFWIKKYSDLCELCVAVVK